MDTGLQTQLLGRGVLAREYGNVDTLYWSVDIFLWDCGYPGLKYGINEHRWR